MVFCEKKRALEWFSYKPLLFLDYIQIAPFPFLFSSAGSPYFLTKRILLIIYQTLLLLKVFFDIIELYDISFIPSNTKYSSRIKRFICLYLSFQNSWIHRTTESIWLAFRLRRARAYWRVGRTSCYSTTRQHQILSDVIRNSKNIFLKGKMMIGFLKGK